MLSQLQARLGMAVRKTSTLLQRIPLVNAVAMPKLLFVSQHVWPTADITRTAQEFLHHFIWAGDFAPTSRRSTIRNWLHARRPKEGSTTHYCATNSLHKQLPWLHDKNAFARSPARSNPTAAQRSNCNWKGASKAWARKYFENTTDNSAPWTNNTPSTTPLKQQTTDTDLPTTGRTVRSAWTTRNENLHWTASLPSKKSSTVLSIAAGLTRSI
ncbi:TPA: hypothetical protein N0F65_005044 [Lagenidium giganteum]|uniref:Uncharacterized protein n=1 Tax=Lagenidium giganteum TaxID=4803 RepID=A0AAV2ZLK5_9STRA|nr:TPA: hypothetical protein N0F65_005044 [Lagenidium giganteum]